MFDLKYNIGDTIDNANGWKLHVYEWRFKKVGVDRYEIEYLVEDDLHHDFWGTTTELENL